jgi:hypothetical protein
VRVGGNLPILDGYDASVDVRSPREDARLNKIATHFAWQFEDR